VKYAVEMGSRSKTYIPSIIKTGSKVNRENIKIDIHREQGDFISLFYFFNKEIRLKGYWT
jgi:hypothetical protein